jgi:hypothetical protein
MKRVMCMLDLTSFGGSRIYVNAEKIAVIMPGQRDTTNIYLDDGHYLNVKDGMYDIEQALTELFDYRTVDVSEVFEGKETND